MCRLQWSWDLIKPPRTPKYWYFHMKKIRWIRALHAVFLGIFHFNLKVPVVMNSFSLIIM